MVIWTILTVIGSRLKRFNIETAGYMSVSTYKLNWNDHSPRLTLFDYVICIFGAIGVLLFVRVFGNVPALILYFWGLFSIGICLLSVVSLVGKVFVKFSRMPEWRIYILYLCFNIIPGISFLIWQAGKTQIPTPPGCC